MIKENNVDCVIGTTVDAFHHEYIVRAMEAGCDAITEKPMTIDDEKNKAIFDAIERTGKNLRVTFNYRWAPGPTQIRRLLQEEKIIGDVLHVDMEYLLNTSHGADYFRRWHREKDKSGGLIIHKSTHHFDLMNWMLNAVPDTVFGMGRLAFYGKENAEKRGEQVNYDRYTGEEAASDDPFALDLSKDDRLRKLYYESEKHDGYRRDKNVFGENITSEDSMSVLVKYRTGVVLNYSLNAYLPREGFHVAFNGTKGRLEYQEVHGSHIIGSSENNEESVKWERKCIVHPMFGNAYEIELETAEGGHGGADPLLAEQIFSPNPPEEKDGRNAGPYQGAASIMIGVAANKSFASGLPVTIHDVCPQLDGVVHLDDVV